MTALRPYQEQVVGNVREALWSCSSVIIPMPTGSGKTVVAAELIKREVEAGGYAVVLVHRTELVEQMVMKLFAIGVDAGIIKAGYKPRPEQRVQVCSVQTLHARAVRRAVRRGVDAVGRADPVEAGDRDVHQDRRDLHVFTIDPVDAKAVMVPPATRIARSTAVVLARLVMRRTYMHALRVR